MVSGPLQSQCEDCCIFVNRHSPNSLDFFVDCKNIVEVASKQLLLDNIHVLHTIGGDDTNTQAAVLSKYLLDEHNGSVIVIGMPKTIDNDVVPIAQTFGADTAARQG